VVINASTWTVYYQGAVNNSIGTNAPTQSYLREALLNLFAGRPASVDWTVAKGCTIDLPATNVVADYSTVIAPLLQTKCIKCHSPGNIAPFALTNHESVLLWSQSMAMQIREGHMPPWHADPYYGRFTNDDSLSIQEKRTLLGWLDAGAPPGTGPDILTNPAKHCHVLAPADYSCHRDHCLPLH
jgi:hypothetical protein